MGPSACQHPTKGMGQAKDVLSKRCLASQRDVRQIGFTQQRAAAVLLVLVVVGELLCWYLVAGELLTLGNGAGQVSIAQESPRNRAGPKGHRNVLVLVQQDVKPL